MQTYPTLYKRTSAGKIQIWFIERNGEKYRTTSGQIDGKHTTSEWTVAKPKNEGRANATTAEEQAISQIESIYEKRAKQNYYYDIKDVDGTMYFKPMLAVKWADVKDKIKDESVMMQPKLDGMRCIAKSDGLWSRNGEPIISAPHIMEALAPIFEGRPDLILDGELYNHDLKDDFNTIMSCVKKKKPSDEDLLVSRNNIQYWIYDVPSYEKGNLSRDSFINVIIPAEHPHLVTVTTDIVDLDKVDEKAAEYIELGYEGAMVRIKHAEYENKRSKNLIKWKEFVDEEFTIVDILEGEGNRSGVAARAVLALGDGRTFRAGIIGNLDYCRDLLVNKKDPIGKPGTVVFQNFTPDGIPRFAKLKCVRDYE